MSCFLARLLGGLNMLGLLACQSRPDSPPAAPRPVPPTAAAESQAVERPLGRSGYVLSLPADYALKPSEGPDFEVYYFAPADTLARHTFTGGLYFGNHPQGPDSVAAGCRLRRLPGTLLGRAVTWQITHCASGYTANVVGESRSGKPWNTQLNAFGEARSAAELRQLLAVVATLRRASAPAAR